MGIEKFPTNETRSQVIAHRLLKEHPDDLGKILKELKWFYEVSSALVSEDERKRMWGDKERQKEENAIRWNQLASEYGMELTTSQLHDLIWHLEHGIESFPKTRPVGKIEEVA